MPILPTMDQTAHAHTQPAKVVLGMRNDGNTYKDATVDLDGDEFVNCQFDGCTLVYHGGQPPTLTGCGFSNTSIRFDDAAGRTLMFMQAIANPKSGLSDFVKRAFPALAAH